MTGKVQKAILDYLNGPQFIVDVPVAKAASISLICIRTAQPFSKIQPALTGLVKRGLAERTSEISGQPWRDTYRAVKGGAK